MKIVEKQVNELKPIAWNPEIRVSEKKICKLRESIDKNGLMTPIVIDKDGNIIDGTRRWTACKSLGHETIECIISNGKTSNAEKFEFLNSSSMSITNSQMMEIVAGGGIIPQKYMDVVSKIIELLGAKRFREIAKLNIPLGVHGQSLRVALYLQRNQDRKFVGDVLYWMAKNKQIIISRKALEVNYKPEKIFKAITENTPLDVVEIMDLWNEKYQLITQARMTKLVDPFKTRQQKAS